MSLRPKPRILTEREMALHYAYNVAPPAVPPKAQPVTGLVFSCIRCKRTVVREGNLMDLTCEPMEDQPYHYQCYAPDGVDELWKGK